MGFDFLRKTGRDGESRISQEREFQSQTPDLSMRQSIFSI